LLPALQGALGWLRDHSDPDGDGFLEYVDESGRGLANQGWKDSRDAVRFADGSLAAPPIALCEVQGYAYEAAVSAATLLDANIGHLLGTGLLDEDESEAVAAAVTGQDMDGGFGLRTMSDRDHGFAPLSYHCGSVWPHDTAIVLHGLVRAGQSARLGGSVKGLLAAAEFFGYRLPELYSGDDDSAAARPVPYPAACRPQAWSAAAAIVLVQAVLGLRVDVPAGRPGRCRLSRLRVEQDQRDLPGGLGLVLGVVLVVGDDLRPQPGSLLGIRHAGPHALRRFPLQGHTNVGIGLDVEEPRWRLVVTAAGSHDDQGHPLLQR
jgi:glycogen debranching enzyme